ncbi:hypothetical protein EDD86DRAFT_244198 [Gorgonomyces haynaldii]|nr:hypothetical protein EDD86DRAFT_244198 [Gorgonomyces haynaldii]
MMYSTILFAIPAVYARFGQQNPPVQGQVQQAVGGGEGGTLSGSVPGTLLGGADPCAKLQLADKIVATKPGDKAVLDAAKALVHTESNFNPFGAGAAPKFCADAALPATKELRGILALVSDQDLQTPFGAKGGLTAAQINAIATKSVQTPLAADGKSVAQLYKEQGFNDFVGAGNIQGGAAAPPQAPPAQAPPAQQGNQGGNKKVVTVTETVNSCPTEAPQAPQAPAPAAPPAQQGGAAQGGSNVFNGRNLNLCNKAPTMNFGTGFAGSANANEFRFKPLNEDVYKGQSTALNGAIIANFLCDSLNNICKAGAAEFQFCKTTATAAFTAKFDNNLKGTAAGGAAADAWNAVWGVTTNFASGAAAPAQQGGQNNNQGNQGQQNNGNQGNQNQGQQANNCNADALQVIVQGKEHRFGFQGRQVALNPAIPIQNICQKVSANCAQACKQAGDAAVATGVKGFSGDDNAAQLKAMGELADKFNAALGIKTDFANAPGTQAAQGGATGGAAGAGTCKTGPVQVIVKGQEHRFGLDGQQVALNPAIPIQRLCDRAGQSCAAACQQINQIVAASGVKGFSGADDAAKLKAMGQLADQVNKLFGTTTDFTNKPILQ